MINNFQAPRGTKDILPGEIEIWQKLIDKFLETCRSFGFSQIVTPTFETTKLFVHSVGDVTDIVQKEMFSFKDSANRSLTLRPEGTSGVVRAAIENGLLAANAMPLKLCYFLSCFRNERPQAGRFKEFFQFGLEIFGSESPLAEVEIVSLIFSFFKNIEISNLNLELNSIGCSNCRQIFKEKLKQFFESQSENLCEICQTRLKQNPLRLLDCKNEVCAQISTNAPKTLDYLCKDCADHFNVVCSMLSDLKFNFNLNHKLVRGLDYYSKTVFEISTSSTLSQNAICGGGRYDNLIETLWKKPTPAIGCAIGVERLIQQLKQQNCSLINVKFQTDLFIASLGNNATVFAFSIANALRNSGFIVQTNIMNRNLKSQLKFACKVNSKFFCAIGDNELKNNSILIKCTSYDRSFTVSTSNFVSEFSEKFNQ